MSTGPTISGMEFSPTVYLTCLRLDTQARLSSVCLDGARFHLETEPSVWGYLNLAWIGEKDPGDVVFLLGGRYKKPDFWVWCL